MNESLLRELVPSVIGVLVRRGADFASAEDAVQEAMIRALEIWPTYYDALLLMSGAHENKGDLDEALDAAERASEIAVQELGQAAMRNDPGEYRAEFVKLVGKAKQIAGKP